MDSVNKIKNIVNFSFERMQKRMQYITIIYQQELFEKDIQIDEFFDDLKIDENRIKIIEKLIQTTPIIKKMLKQFLNDKKWENIAPLIRAILIYGVFEMQFMDSALVINEMVNITKIYSPGNEYKFVNAVLDNFKV